jgi:hypothetical protein
VRASSSRELIAHLKNPPTGPERPHLSLVTGCSRLNTFAFYGVLATPSFLPCVGLRTPPFYFWSPALGRNTPRTTTRSCLGGSRAFYLFYDLLCPYYSRMLEAWPCELLMYYLLTPVGIQGDRHHRNTPRYVCQSGSLRQFLR